MPRQPSASEVEAVLLEVLRQAGAEDDATMLLAEALRFAAKLEVPTASSELRAFVRGPLRRTAADARGKVFAGRMTVAMVSRFGWGATEEGLGRPGTPTPSTQPPKHVSMPPAGSGSQAQAITMDYGAGGEAAHRLEVVVFDLDSKRGKALVAALSSQGLTAVLVEDPALLRKVCEGMRPIVLARPAVADDADAPWRNGIDPGELAPRHAAYPITATSDALRVVVDQLGDNRAS